MSTLQTIVDYTGLMKRYYIESYLRDVQLLKSSFIRETEVVGLNDLRAYELSELKQLVFVTNRKLRENASKRLKELRDEQKAADLAARPAPVWEKFPYKALVPATK